MSIFLPEIKAVADEIMPLRARAMTSRQIEQATWKIWGISRENKDSLNSEKFCNLIRDVIVGSITDVQKQLESRVKENEVDKGKLRDARKQITELKKEISEMKNAMLRFKQGAERHEETKKQLKTKINGLQKKLDAKESRCS